MPWRAFSTTASDGAPTDCRYFTQIKKASADIVSGGFSVSQSSSGRSTSPNGLTTVLSLGESFFSPPAFFSAGVSSVREESDEVVVVVDVVVLTTVPFFFSVIVFVSTVVSPFTSVLITVSMVVSPWYSVIVCVVTFPLVEVEMDLTRFGSRFGCADGWSA